MIIHLRKNSPEEMINVCEERACWENVGFDGIFEKTQT